MIFGDGSNGRDFTYVTEIAAGLWLAAGGDALVGRTVNLAYGRMITISDVAVAVLRACGLPCRPIRAELATCYSFGRRLTSIWGSRCICSVPQPISSRPVIAARRARAKLGAPRS